MKFERTTGMVSALVAAAILGAVVTAQPSRTLPRDRLASLESDLRFQLELRWRQNRGTYNQRVAELETSLKAWQKSPQSEADANLMAQWLREAIVQSLPGESGELPPAPAFGEKPTKAIVAAATREKQAGRGGTLESAVRSQGSNARPNGAKQTNAHAVAPNHSGVHRAVTMPARSQPAINPPTRVLASSSVERGTPRATPPSISSAKQTPAPAPLAKAASAQRKAEPLRMANNTAPTEQSVTAQKVQAEAAKSSNVTERAAKPIEVNLAELNARIGGYHDGLDEVEAAVVAANGDVSEKATTRWVERLEELAGQYAFVRLYYDALSAEEREFVAAPRSMAATVTLVAQHCEGIEDAASGDFLESSDDSSRGELAKRLDAVAKAARGDRTAEADSK